MATVSERSRELAAVLATGASARPVYQLIEHALLAERRLAMEEAAKMVEDMEENKVAQKLAELIGKFFVPKIAEYERAGVSVRIFPKEELADAILQSPDLRVTLAEPRYFLASSSAGSYLRERTSSNGDWNNVAFFYDADKRAAKDVCDWLNSKEPK